MLSSGQVANKMDEFKEIVRALLEGGVSEHDLVDIVYEIAADLIRE